MDWITERVKFIAQVLIFTTDDEMKALAKEVVRILTGKEQGKIY